MLYPWRLPILATKPWRLIRELNGFTDSECRAFIQALLPARSLLLVAATILAGVLGISMVVAAQIAGEWLLGRTSPLLDTGTLAGRAVASTFACLLLGIVPAIALAPYCLAMRSMIRRHLRRVGCPSCRYSLLGLNIRDGRVRCPECGTDFALFDHGLTAADIIAGTRQRPARAPERDASVRFFFIGAGLLLAVLAAWTLTGSHSVLTGGLMIPLAAGGLVVARSANRPLPNRP